MQYNPYIMMRVRNKYDLPVDAELYPMVNKLRKLGFWMEGWNYGCESSHESFINCTINPCDPQRNTLKKLAGRLAKIFTCVSVRTVLKEPKHMDPQDSLLGSL